VLAFGQRRLGLSGAQLCFGSSDARACLQVAACVEESSRCPRHARHDGTRGNRVAGLYFDT
jgi:hypothetical protein